MQQKQRQRRNVTDPNDQVDLKAHIRGIPDFPKPGILFYDISTLLRHPGQRVVILDDLLATGGTMAAGIGLLRQAGAVVPAAAALIELSFLDGRKKLDVPFEALVSYSE